MGGGSRVFMKRLPPSSVFLGLLAIFLVFSATLILSGNLSSGVILGEPDEFVHAQITQNLLKNPIPTYGTAPFFYDLPGLFAVSSMVERIVGNPLVAVRLVSLLSTAVLGLLIYFYLREKGLGRVAAVGGTLIFYSTPLTIFYSQVGLIEPLLSLFLFCFLVFFDLFLDSDRVSLAVLSGVFLAFALLTKYTAFSSVFLIAVVFLYRLVKFSLQEFKNSRKAFLVLDKGTFMTLAIPVATLLPVVIYFYRKFPWEFKLQTFQALGLTQMAVFRPLTNFNGEFLSKITWWFPWPPLLAGAVGLFIFLFWYRGRAVFFLVNFLILFILVLSRAPFHPRYLVVLLPSWAFLGAFFLEGLARLVPVVKLRGVAGVTLFILYIFFYRSLLGESYFSSKHDLLENAARYVKSSSVEGRDWVMSNYWPNIVVRELPGKRFAWLTIDNKEVQIFNPQEKRTGRQIIKAGEAVVVTEDLYSGTLVYPPPRYEALVEIKRLQPEAVIYDKYPNFPFFRNSGNSVNIYIPSNL